MRIAYLSTDEVNADLARRWASTCSCEVIPLWPRDPLPNGDYDAEIYDLDFLPPTLRQQVLTNLLSGPLHCPVAVHSYGLSEQHASDLRARGVFVWSRLERVILVLLRRAVHRIRAEAGRVEADATPSTHRTKRLPRAPETPNTFLAG
jgi:hypothetical protein